MDYTNYNYNPLVENIVDILENRSQLSNRDFFRLQVNFYLTLIPSSMGVKINSPITGRIPINLYGINLSPSGSGKGFSTNILETEVINKFVNKFVNDIFTSQSKIALDIEAINREKLEAIPHQIAVEKLEKEFKSLGAIKFTFDSATVPALKQYRHKLLLAKIGAINFIVDEIGANLKNNLEVLNACMELYDNGVIKDKLLKSTQENVRYIEVTGSTPTNVMLFGTPSKLLDGGNTEEEFFQLLESGYARRSFFANNKVESTLTNCTPEELFERISRQEKNNDLSDISSNLAILASLSLCNVEITMSKELSIELLAYRQNCEIRAKKLPSQQEILKTELLHRYFKTLKLAATYAFIEGKLSIEQHHLQQAIRFAEDSGIALTAILNREMPYHRLAKFIAEGLGKQYTQADFTELLPYYKGNISQKNEMIKLAISWGYKNSILIKKVNINGIDFYSGESLKLTDLSKIKVSYSQYFGNGYIDAELDWKDDFPKLISSEGYNWVNHHLLDGKRNSDSVISGFNVIVLDIDEGTTLSAARTLLSNYEYLIYTTKRHNTVDETTGEVCERYRIVLPMNYELTLSELDFKKFMENVNQWLPFNIKVDSQTFQRCRMWACHAKGEIYTNTGELIDVLPFIPNTTKEIEYHAAQKGLSSMDAVEKWFFNEMQKGNRNNTFLRFALMLLDNGVPIDDIKSKILNFNKKLSEPLAESELKSTVFKTLETKSLTKLT